MKEYQLVVSKREIEVLKALVEWFMYEVGKGSLSEELCAELVGEKIELLSKLQEAREYEGDKDNDLVWVGK